MFRQSQFPNGDFYLCLKSWSTDSGTYFEEGKYYDGSLNLEGDTLYMIGEFELPMRFKVEDGYFKVK